MKWEIEKLLTEFKSIDYGIIYPSTYLEICRYPYSRFEEICSRILSYFFNPDNEHGLKDLFLKSFFGLNTIKINNPTTPTNFKNIKVRTEENAEGKRLDVIILSEEFIIGIENKITANLYNPLPIYNALIEKHPQNIKYKIVLSVKKIVDINELQLMQNAGFVNILYIELIDEIRNNIGKYISNQNQHSTYILNDFIKTMENMSNNNYLNNENDNFFIKNSSLISDLVQKNDDFHSRLSNLRCNRYNELVSEMIIKTKDENWWVYQCYGIGINKFGEVKDIGIECVYEFEYNEHRNPNENALGKFLIYVTAWNDNVWNDYKEKITCNLEVIKKQNEAKKDGHKTTILYATIFDNDTDKIISTLYDGYTLIANSLNK
ncbi:MAG: PD-(D/E)XK nuclease family protein [Bacteroidetes bacterium]|nr:PD-(D/E)XK nuclease family protein [Bacteroidota bacterium]